LTASPVTSNVYLKNAIFKSLIPLENKSDTAKTYQRLYQIYFTMARRTQTAAGATFALKTDLQRRRDHYGFKIRKDFPPRGARPHRNPRGIAPHNNTCYQAVVQQALLHTPAWLDWIRTHDVTDANHPVICNLCTFKQLADMYWGAENADTPIPHNLTQLRNIEARAAAANASGFAVGQPGDAAEFYDWAIDALEEQVSAVPAVTAGTVDEWKKMLWNEELAALYQLDYQQSIRCEGCAHETITTGADKAIEISCDGSAPIAEQLETYFVGLQSIYCRHCAAFDWHWVDRSIESAPQVLRAYVSLNNENRPLLGPSGKDMLARTVPETLDLTWAQMNSRLPLTYTLSSVIAHGASGSADPVVEEEEERVLLATHATGDEHDSPVAVAVKRAIRTGPRIKRAGRAVNGNRVLANRVEVPQGPVDSVLGSDINDIGLDRRKKVEVTPGPNETAGPREYRHASIWNGLARVTNEDYINELGPGMDMPEAFCSAEDDSDEPKALYRIGSFSTAVEETSARGFFSEAVTSLLRKVLPRNTSFLNPFVFRDKPNEYINPRRMFGFEGETPDDELEALGFVGEKRENDLDYLGFDGDDGNSSSSDDWDLSPIESDEDLSDEDDIYHIVNVRGPDQKWHLADNHFTPLADGQLQANPQQPTDVCQRPGGYQVVVLTYTRDKLRGKSRSLERLIPAWEGR
jgi:hypothetical protein